MEAGRCEDMDLDTGAVEGIVGGGRGAVEDEDREMAQQGVDGLIKSDMIGREGQIVGNANHGDGGVLSSQWVGS